MERSNGLCLICYEGRLVAKTMEYCRNTSADVKWDEPGDEIVHCLCLNRSFVIAVVKRSVALNSGSLPAQQGVGFIGLHRLFYRKKAPRCLVVAHMDSSSGLRLLSG